MYSLGFFTITALLLLSTITTNGNPLKNDDDDKRENERLKKASLIKREADPVGGHRRRQFGGPSRRPNSGRDRLRQQALRLINRNRNPVRGKRETDSVVGLRYKISRGKRSPEERGEDGQGRYPKKRLNSRNKSNIFARKKLINNRG